MGDPDRAFIKKLIEAHLKFSLFLILVKHQFQIHSSENSLTNTPGSCFRALKKYFENFAPTWLLIGNPRFVVVLKSNKYYRYYFIRERGFVSLLINYIIPVYECGSGIWTLTSFLRFDLKTDFCDLEFLGNRNT